MFLLDSIEYNVEATSSDIWFFFTNEAPNAKTVKKTILQNQFQGKVLFTCTCTEYEKS